MKTNQCLLARAAIPRAAPPGQAQPRASGAHALRPHRPGGERIWRFSLHWLCRAVVWDAGYAQCTACHQCLLTEQETANERTGVMCAQSATCLSPCLQGRPQAPGLEVLHEGPEGTSAEVRIDCVQTRTAPCAATGLLYSRSQPI